MRTHVLSLSAAFACALVARAQEAEPVAGFVALHQALLDASTDGVVLNVAAHPDDESSRTNTILRRKHGLRVVTVYSTYGDGGQNAIGREIGPELASLRVRETLRAAAMSDVEVLWLGMDDFGYSKTLEETLKAWNGEELKSRMGAVLDRVRPSLVLTNHSLTQGHGHHRASFWAISEVLKERAAAGASVPPLYSRCGVEKAQVTFDPSELDPARGETYARLAHRAWTQHVTQGPWGPHNPLQVGKEHWQLVLPEGVASDRAADLVGLARVEPATGQLPADAWRMPPAELRAAVLAQCAAIEAQMQAAAAERSTAGRARMRTLRQRFGAMKRILLAQAGVRTEVWLDDDEVAIGGTGKAFVVVHGVDRTTGLEVSCRGVAATPVNPTIRTTPFDGASPTPTPTPPTNGAAAADGTANAAPPPAPAVPGRFSVTFEPEPANGPEPRFADVVVEFRVDGEPFSLHHPLAYTPVERVVLQWDREVVLVPKGQTCDRLLSASVASHGDVDTIRPIRLSMGPGIRAVPTPSRMALSPEHSDARLLVRATIDAADLTADAGIEVGFGPHAARLRVVAVDVSVPPGLRVGLVRGPDDTIERALADLGITFTALDRDALMTARLEDFTTVLLDIRAYHHRPELGEVKDRLLQYCRAGGRVVAMYHKPGEWNERAGRPLLAPFPMTIGNDRICEEDSPVKMLLPEHSLWHHPHPITAADFADWVQERGLNFPTKWDTAWTPLLELKDSGDAKPHLGALLHTQSGRGDFIYCSLALYRQLRIGNAGACRLLVNLLAK